MYKLLPLIFVFLSLTSFAQVVEEIIQLDTSSTKLKVIYRQPTEGYYFKKIAVYADDTNQVAIQKTFTNYGQNGVTKVFYPSGKIMINAIYANSKINGDWTWFDKNENIRVKGQYKAGVKHGYWAYKHVRTYGKYKKGRKSGKWKFYDENGIKHLSYYKNGICYKGETGVSEIPSTFSLIAHKKGIPPIDSSYYTVIHHFNKNYLFRKKFKYFFGASKKERAALDKHFNYKQDYFKFKIAPIQVPLLLNPFDSYSQQKTIENTVIDSVLNTIQLPQNDSLVSDSGLYYQSTDTLAEVIIYISKIENSLIKVEILKCVLPDENINYHRFYKENKCKKFSILYYLDEKKKIIAVEYAQPQ